MYNNNLNQITMKVKMILMLILLVGFSCSNEPLQEADLSETFAKGKPVRGIYLEGNTIETLTQGQTDRNPTRVFWDASVAPYQNMIISVKRDGVFKPRYQFPTDGANGFPLSYNNKDVNGIYLTAGDTCRIYFFSSEKTTPEFVIPSKGKK